MILHKTFKALTFLFFTCVLSPNLTAQAYKIEGTEPVFNVIPSPEFSRGYQKAFKPKEWLEIEAGFKVKMSPEPASKTAERITVKWYVAVEHPDKRGTYMLLTKEITHVNVPLNEEVFTSVYLSPASVKRLTGSDSGGSKSVQLMGYEVLVNGQVLDSKTNKEKVGWWNSSSNKISRSDSVPLLDKSESCFANMWWDRYAEILAKRP